MMICRDCQEIYLLLLIELQMERGPVVVTLDCKQSMICLLNLVKHALAGSLSQLCCDQRRPIRLVPGITSLLLWSTDCCSGLLQKATDGFGATVQ